MQQNGLIDIDWRRWHLTSLIPHLEHFLHDLLLIYKTKINALYYPWQQLPHTRVQSHQLQKHLNMFFTSNSLYQTITYELPKFNIKVEKKRIVGAGERSY